MSNTNSPVCEFCGKPIEESMLYKVKGIWDGKGICVSCQDSLTGKDGNGPWYARLPSLTQLREEVELCLLSTRMADSANKMLPPDAPSNHLTRDTSESVEETYRMVREYLPSVIRNTPGINAPPVNNGGDRISYLHDFAEWAALIEQGGSGGNAGLTRMMSKREIADALDCDERTATKLLGEALIKEGQQWWRVDLARCRENGAVAIANYLQRNPERPLKKRKALQKAAQSAAKSSIPKQ